MSQPPRRGRATRRSPLVSAAQHRKMRNKPQNVKRNSVKSKAKRYG